MQPGCLQSLYSITVSMTDGTGAAYTILNATPGKVSDQTWNLVGGRRTSEKQRRNGECTGENERREHLRYSKTEIECDRH